MLKHATDQGTPMGLFGMWAPEDTKKAAESFKSAVPFFADFANLDERLMTSCLALLSQGQVSPKRLPGNSTENA
jgi:hypothetical protein